MDAHLTVNHACAYSHLWWSLMLWSDLTELAVAVADVDRFYWNLATCLQFNVSVLALNFVKIRRCLPEIWQCIHYRGTVFSSTQCRIKIALVHGGADSELNWIFSIHCQYSVFFTLKSHRYWLLNIWYWFGTSVFAVYRSINSMRIYSVGIRLSSLTDYKSLINW